MYVTVGKGQESLREYDTSHPSIADTEEPIHKRSDQSNLICCLNDMEICPQIHLIM